MSQPSCRVLTIGILDVLHLQAAGVLREHASLMAAMSHEQEPCR
jgi:hypothetical protein